MNNTPDQAITISIERYNELLHKETIFDMKKKMILQKRICPDDMDLFGIIPPREAKIYG